MDLGSDRNPSMKDRGVCLGFTPETMTRNGKLFAPTTATKATRKSAKICHSYGDELLESRETPREVAREGRDDFPCAEVEKHNKGNNSQVRLPSDVIEEMNDDNLRDPISRNAFNRDIKDEEPTLLNSRKEQVMKLEDNIQNGGLFPTERVLPTPATREVHYPVGDGDIDRINIRENFAKLQHRNAIVTPPASPPMFKRRRRKVSMFEIQPRNPPEVAEIQEICIEKGVVQTVQNSAITLPELKVNSKALRAKDTSGNLVGGEGQVINIEALRSHDFDKKPNKILGHAKSNPGDSSKVLLDANDSWTTSSSTADLSGVQSGTLTPISSPRLRRRSLGVVTTAAWGLNTYREYNAITDASHSPRTRRISSPASPAGDLITNRRKDSWKNNITKNSSDELQRRLSKPSNEHIVIRKKRQTVDGNEAKIPGKCDTNMAEQNGENEYHTNSGKEHEDFRPRLRSRSLEDFRFMARQRVLETREPSKCKHAKESRVPVQSSPRPRRKSFEVWLSDKEKETIRKMNLLKLEKQREAEEEAAKRLQRKGKSYEEWLSEKTNEEIKNKSWITSRSETKLDTNERQRVAQERYQKWLLEKETQALEKERQMLKEAERKTIEMRKKYEEKRKNEINGVNYYKGSV